MIEITNQGIDGSMHCIVLDAAETLQAIYEHSSCPPMLRSVLSGAISWQKRNEMKVSAAIRWSAQWAAALMALGSHASTDDQEESLSAFLKRGGVIGKLNEIRVPLDVPGRRWGENHVRRTPSDTPIVSSYVVVDIANGVINRANLAMTGVWEETAALAEAASLLCGKSFQEETLSSFLKALEAEVNPKSNFMGSVDYRREMAVITSRRALEMCFQGGEKV